ncbi:LysM peptidoglycan-binding domain-containing protein [Nocardiopsis mangrovi]|uniref:LysM peptidoglycan-binding domain-containing protein n=1 Tax=Nocardiopsis mangrovi TaxID=1179818 RepID=A0ABV9DRU9_9ACTN
MSEPSVLRPRGPVLFDWAQEIPEWRTAPVKFAARPAVAGAHSAVGPPDLPDLNCAIAPGIVPPVVRRGWTRLTRRGRVVLVSTASATATGVLSVFFLTAVAAGASASGAPAASAFLPASSSTVVVRDGDTLWGIAERVRPGDDPRRTVHEIVRINELPSSELEPGQELVLP